MDLRDVRAGVDLRTTYLGLELAHPIVASASPVSKTLDGIRKLEDGGAAAIVLFSLFEEQIRRERAAYHRLTRVGTESYAEALSYFPAVRDFRVGPEEYSPSGRPVPRSPGADSGGRTSAGTVPAAGPTSPRKAARWHSTFPARPRGTWTCT